MSYNPHDYLELFPKGLFEFASKPIKTWFDSHKLFALNMIPFKKESRQIAEGLILKKGNIKIRSGFSNYMIFEIDTRKRKPKLEFFQREMLFPVDAFRRLKKPYLLSNAGYFYLTDDEKKDPTSPPKIRTGNLVIENGNLLNLPILDRSALVVRNNKIDLLFLRAFGIVEIDGKKYEWVGSKASGPKDKEIVVYNSSNIIVKVVNDPIMGPSRRAEKVFASAPVGKLLYVCNRRKGHFSVGEVGKKKVLVNDKDMVLEVNRSVKIKKGSKITFRTIDSLELRKVQSAVSVGPLLYSSYQKTKKQVEKEFSVSDMANPVNPHEEKKNLARGAIVKIDSNRLAIVLVDGIPQAGEIYPGVTLKEFVGFLNLNYPKFISAIATDPSNSLKAVYKSDSETLVFGNSHYLAYKRNSRGKLEFWPNGRRGRKINSAIVVY